MHVINTCSYPAPLCTKYSSDSHANKCSTNTCEINLNISEYFAGTPMGQGNIELTKAFLKVSLAGDFSA